MSLPATPAATPASAAATAPPARVAAAPDTAQRFDFVELASLRQEILLRMLVQNLVLVMVMPLLFASWLAAVLVPAAAMLIACGYCLAAGVGALIWCHNGVRQAQIKAYLLVLEGRYADGSGWERWLPAHRLGGILGARWLISTKGVLIGSQLAAVAAAVVVTPGGVWPWGAAQAIVIVTTAAFLLFNPRESLQPIAAQPVPPDAGDARR